MINILPHNQKKIVEKIRTLRVVAITLWALIALAVVAGVLLIPLFVTINSRFSIVNQQISALEQQGVVVSPVDVASLQERVNVLARKLTTKEVPSPIEYIDMIRSASVSGIVLSGFVFVPGQSPLVEVAGTASSRQSLQNFVATLEKNPTVTLVESPVSNYVKSTNSPFNIAVTFITP